MAVSCNLFRTNLARQTPVYDKIFLPDFKPLDSPVLGRHETESWQDGTGDTHVFDRIHIGQPNLTESWQRIDAAECASAVCSPPSQFVSFGTERNTYYKEQFQLRSQPFCMTQLRHQTNPGAQIAEIMRGLKKIPEMYMTDWIQVHAFDFAPTVQIAGNDFATFTPIRGTNTAGQLVTINLGNDNNLPESQLTWPYLNYLTTQLGLEGYFEAGSGLAQGMYNLITHSRTWFKLTNGMDAMKDMMALTDPQQASPLFKIGVGVQKPFGNIAPTLNEQQIRFQRQGPGLLSRVFPYINVATTTGIKRQVNPAYLNARYALSFLWHPKAIKIWTPSFGRIHSSVPSINSSFYGNWQFVNSQGVLQIQNTDGTVCTVNNDDQRYFYWLVDLEQGFQYRYPELLMPILHLIDGSGRACMVNDPVCGDAPQYVAQDYSDDPDQCEVAD
jgi:hypothetical protein